MNVLARQGSGQTSANTLYPLLILIPMSIIVGVALARSASPLIIGALLAIVPVVILQITFIRNLYIGLVAFLIVEYLQPGHRLPLVSHMRPALLIASSLLLAWILNVMQHRTKLVMNWQVKSYAVFLLLGVGSALTAVSVGMVGKSVISMAKTLAVFMIIYSIIDTVPKLKKLIFVYVYLHLILSVMAFALFFTTGERNFGDLGGSFLGDENDSAMALVIMIPYAYFMLPLIEKKWLKIAVTMGMFFASAAVLYSFSRGAFIGFLTMVAYVFSKSQHKARAFAALAVALVVLFVSMPPEYWDRIESTKNYGTEGSAQGRLDAWKGGIKIMIDSPLFGAGLGNFNRAYGEGYNTISARWTAAHSMYVQFIGELGVPGVLFLITTIVLTFKGFRRVRLASRRRDEPEYVTLLAIARGAECGFATYLVTTVFLNSMMYPHLWHFGAVSGCAVLALDHLQRQERQSDLKVLEAREAAHIP